VRPPTKVSAHEWRAPSIKPSEAKPPHSPAGIVNELKIIDGARHGLRAGVALDDRFPEPPAGDRGALIHN